MVVRNLRPAASALANAMKDHRSGKNVSQQRLAATVGVTKDSISNWENGVVIPNQDSLHRFCEALVLNKDDRDHLIELRNTAIKERDSPLQTPNLSASGGAETGEQGLLQSGDAPGPKPSVISPARPARSLRLPGRRGPLAFPPVLGAALFFLLCAVAVFVGRQGSLWPSQGPSTLPTPVTPHAWAGWVKRVASARHCALEGCAVYSIQIDQPFQWDPTAVARGEPGVYLLVPDQGSQPTCQTHAALGVTLRILACHSHRSTQVHEYSLLKVLISRRQTDSQRTDEIAWAQVDYYGDGRWTAQTGRTPAQ